MAVAVVLVSGCASVARYAEGPLPPSALPEPAASLAVAGPPGQAPTPLAEADLQGRVRRVAVEAGPAHGFTLDIDSPKGLLLVRVVTFAPARLDLSEGREVRLRLAKGPALLLRLDDARGPLFLVSAGPSAPEGADLPVEVRPGPRRAYVEVSSSQDLCRWNVLQRSVEVTARGVPLATIAPGASTTVAAKGQRYGVTAIVASSPEESDCGQVGEPRLAFFWSRLGGTP